ncbi:hypothetical protein AVL62_02500 [Serinicoccus chungangensis]|uniref:Uncharacterized protein n=1 Tax=Serinicoccus chungangensis TaxID=767452 RepID=A0A0W8I5X5_9MICO|nr:hypothetical protein [Serinicoccus chungangensis]KUG53667.1 hypothetical protein AVL62_02500 [Serinicoccus chungangensis]
MRWEQLFADLEGQQADWERRERAAEAAEHTRAEHGRVVLGDRLAADVGRVLRLGVRGVGALEARLVDVGPDWVLAHEVRASAYQERLVATAALLSVEGLSGRVDDRPRRYGLRHAVRALSRDRARVRVFDQGGDHLSGTVDRALADHLDLARHADDEPRRPGAVRGVVALPYSTIAMVQRL